jgi:small subunit ribosomal protein S20
MEGRSNSDSGVDGCLSIADTARSLRPYLAIEAGDAFVPNKESAKKRIRQDAKRRARNRWRKGTIKDGIKSFLDAIAHKDVPAAEDAFKVVQKQFDKVAATSTMHKNKAARSKSRLSKRLRELKTAG